MLDFLFLSNRVITFLVCLLIAIYRTNLNERCFQLLLSKLLGYCFLFDETCSSNGQCVLLCYRYSPGLNLSTTLSGWLWLLKSLECGYFSCVGQLLYFFVSFVSDGITLSFICFCSDNQLRLSLQRHVPWKENIAFSIFLPCILFELSHLYAIITSH